MSKIEQLIQELCPGGVPIVTVADVCQIKNGKDYKHLEKGNFPVWGTGGIMTYVNEFAYDKPSVLLPRKGSIENVYFTDEPFWTVDTLFYTIINVDIIIPKFLFVIFSNINLKAYNTSIGNRPSLTQTVLNAIEIPLPPLPIQQEIVRILDTFTEAQANLEQELELRKKQYEYYRNQLLSFDENDPSVKWMKMADIACFKYGYTDKAKDEGTARYIRITDISPDGNLLKTDAKYIDIDDLNKSYLLKNNDLLMARTGATFGKTLLFKGAEPAIYASFLIKIDFKEEEVNPVYYWQFSRSYYYWNQANKLVSGGAQPQFNTGAIGEVIVPVPSKDRQQEIVSILDKFESAIQTLEEELALRKKQYEYYREKLLSFN